MDSRSDTLRRFARFTAEVVAETLWPTRCALCDAPGEVLCGKCARKLPYLDWWKACKRCGSAYGRVQCDLCNPVALARIGRDELPFSGCASATIFTGETGELVRVYKDQGERRLAAELAARMVRAIPPAWEFDAVTYVPASKAAFRQRGFDHAELLAGQVAELSGIGRIGLLGRPKARDQRGLGARGRIANLNAAFKVERGNADGLRLLLVDDVMTTGATLCAASDALLGAGAERVFGLTFARA